MEAAVDLAHKTVEDLSRKVIGLATDGAESPAEITRWYFACLIEAMTQLGVMSRGITISAVNTLSSKVKSEEELDAEETVGSLLKFVESQGDLYGKSLTERVGKGEPHEFQESFIAFLKLSDMLKEDDDGHKKP
jgi:hypothetical protein